MHRIRMTLCMALAAILLDQLCKWWLLEVVGIAAREPITLAPFFRLVMVWNYGISFGMLAHPGTAVPWFLQAVALSITAVLAVLAWRSPLAQEKAAYGLIIGGALGNVIDRFRFGAVADFFLAHIGPYAWPAFNIADASIFCGVVWLVGLSLFRHKGQADTDNTQQEQ